MITPQVKPVPEWMHTVTPHLICAGAADAIEFYKKAFDAVEMARVPGPQGKLIHACIQIGDSVVEWKIMNTNHYTYEMYTKDKDGKEFKSLEISYKRL